MVKADIERKHARDHAGAAASPIGPWHVDGEAAGAGREARGGRHAAAGLSPRDRCLPSGDI